MKKIGVIGESSNDTEALCKVWNKRYVKQAQFAEVLKNLQGNQLDTPKAVRMMKVEASTSGRHSYVYIRDLDGPRSSKTHWEKVNKSHNLFSSLGKVLLLANIQMIEALILGDLETFNKLYKTKLKPYKNPESKDEPKKFLKDATSKTAKKYHENDCIDLIPKLDFSKVESNCQFYRDFIQKLDKAIS